MKKICAVAVVVLLLGNLAYSEEGMRESKNWGFIFNTSTLLLDIESYQAGLGVKILMNENIGLRFLADGYYSSSADTFSMTLGTAFEKYIMRKRVSPYWGGFIEGGFMVQTEETDEDNWVRNSAVPFGAGAVLGVEFFIIENVSLFAEYNLTFEGSVLRTTTMASGTETQGNAEFAFSIDTGIGNEAMLGVVIYMDDVIQIEKGFLSTLIEGIKK